MRILDLAGAIEPGMWWMGAPLPKVEFKQVSKRVPIFVMSEEFDVKWYAEKSGGRASDGFKRILDIEPTNLHQKTPIFIGSKEMVEKAGEFMAEYSSVNIY